VYLQVRTTENFVQRICKKFSIDGTRVNDIVFLNSEGIVNRMNDEVLRKMPNEQPLEIEFVPVSAGPINTSAALEELKMRVYL